MGMTREKCVNLIVEPSGPNVPCMITAPTFGQSSATLDPDELSIVITKRCDGMMRSHLWERLHQLACPAFAQDRTLALCNMNQEGPDLSGAIKYLPLSEYKELCLRHLKPLVNDAYPEVVYALIFIQGLAGPLRTQVESKFRGHHGVQIMECAVQMNLLEASIAVAEFTNLESGVIAKVVHTTSLASMTVLINAVVNSGASTPQAVQELAQICAMSSTGPPQESMSPADVTGVKSNYGQSAAEIFLSGDRLCFCYGRKLGRRDGECRGMASGKCPMAGDQEAMRKGKVRMAEFKALQEKHPHSGRGQAGDGKSTRWRHTTKGRNGQEDCCCCP